MSERPAVDNGSDRRQVRKAEKKAVVRRKQEIADIRTFLDLEAGRRFIWRLLEHCKVFQSIWHNSALIHFNEGKRDVGLFILSEITEADQKALLRMMTDAANEKTRDRLHDEKEERQARTTENEDEPGDTE